MRQRRPVDLLVGRVKYKAVLQLAHNHHFGNGFGKPPFDLGHHVLKVCIDQAVELIRTEAKPRHGLQEAVRAPVRAATSYYKLPELEANNLRVFPRPTKLPNKIRCPLSDSHFHLLLGDFVFFGTKLIVGLRTKTSFSGPVISPFACSSFSNS